MHAATESRGRDMHAFSVEMEGCLGQDAGKVDSYSLLSMVQRLRRIFRLYSYHSAIALSALSVWVIATLNVETAYWSERDIVCQAVFTLRVTATIARQINDGTERTNWRKLQ